jgi:enoyl-CoA hydratase
MRPAVTVDRSVDKIARIVVDRVERHNAQDTRLLYDLNTAFDQAAHDDDISVIVVAARGPNFSAGHDLKEEGGRHPRDIAPTVGTWGGFLAAGCEGTFAREHELYLGLSERWRNLPKPTIAEVHGLVISGGLMLAWPCDLIVAAEDTVFIDNTVSLGVSGAEFFHHLYEVGARKAKEMLFTSAGIDAQEALRLGMVNHVVPTEQLTEFTSELASRIARQPLFALRLAKQAVNLAQDAQGRSTAMQAAFALHQVCHGHNQLIHGSVIDPAGLR